MKKPVSNPKAKRENYLLGKLDAGMHLALGSVLMILGGGLFLFLLLFHMGGPGASLIYTLFGILFTVGILFCYKGVKIARSVAYVPPIREQVEALPDEEVLVRGSQSPPFTPEELLRPLDGKPH